MDFKWIGFLIEWALNEFDHRKNGLDHKNWIFCPPLSCGIVACTIHMLTI